MANTNFVQQHVRPVPCRKCHHIVIAIAGEWIFRIDFMWPAHIAIPSYKRVAMNAYEVSCMMVQLIVMVCKPAT